MVTPRSERAAWPTLDFNLNALDYPMTTIGMNMNGASHWLGTDEISPFPSSGLGGNDGIGANGDRKNHELDFFSF